MNTTRWASYQRRRSRDLEAGRPTSLQEVEAEYELAVLEKATRTFTSVKGKTDDDELAHYLARLEVDESRRRTTP